MVKDPGTAGQGGRPPDAPLTEAACASRCAEGRSAGEDAARGERRFDSSWVLEFLDGRHADIRAEGIAWFRSEPLALRDDVNLWRRLGESPHDDVRLFLVSELEARVAGRDFDRIASLALDGATLRLLWASVLLNIHRGSRAKPKVVRQIVRAIRRRAEDAESLLPLLAVALRSARGPERRAGLAAVAELVERRSQAAAQVNVAFPELKLL